MKASNNRPRFWTNNRPLIQPGQFLTRLLSIVCLATIILSCKKDPDVQPKNNDFPVVYRFINKSSASLKALNFTTATYFPKTDRTSLFYKYFPDIAPGDTARIVIDTSAVTKTLAYIGCVYQLEVDVTRYVTPRLMHVSVWHTKPHEIKSRDDANVYFNWPTDTLNAERVSSKYIQL